MAIATTVNAQIHFHMLVIEHPYLPRTEIRTSAVGVHFGLAKEPRILSGKPCLVNRPKVTKVTVTSGRTKAKNVWLKLSGNSAAAETLGGDDQELADHMNRTPLECAAIKPW